LRQITWWIEAGSIVENLGLQLFADAAYLALFASIAYSQAPTEIVLFALEQIGAFLAQVEPHSALWLIGYNTYNIIPQWHEVDPYPAPLLNNTNHLIDVVEQTLLTKKGPPF